MRMGDLQGQVSPQAQKQPPEAQLSQATPVFATKNGQANALPRRSLSLFASMCVGATPPRGSCASNTRPTAQTGQTVRNWLRLAVTSGGAVKVLTTRKEITASSSTFPLIQE
jgi:hypothetical protein